MSDRGENLSAAKLALAIKRLRSEQPGIDLLRSEPIAVIGIGCRYPGGLQSPQDFWRVLRQGSNLVTEIPEERWDAERYYNADPMASGKMNTRWGGFVDCPDQFDASFFGISPREAGVIDPQQRLLLEVAWESLWDAGIAPDRLAGTSTGVFLGMYGTDYSRLLLENPAAVGPHTCAGAAHSMGSGRISFLLDLHGPSITVDTACSSSLVSVYLAVQSLRSGDCKMAMAGGVSLKLRPEHYLCLSKLGMVSPDGRCATFDASGNGFVPGEGCGIVLLKPLTEALIDGNRIYAVIRGAAANQDGRTNVLTAPNGLAQKDVVSAAIENARIAPGDITYVEAHGTGTSLGDPIEVEALTKALGSAEWSDRPCALGSVKTNLGHLEAASGITGFIKAALALHYEEIPPNLHFRELNPNVVLDGTRFFIPVEPIPWARSDRGRFAGVSAFGFSGTNAHIVLEESPRIPSPRGSTLSPGKSLLLPISARTPDACDAFARAYATFAGAEGQPPLYDICQNAAVRRSHYEERLALTADSPEQLGRRLEHYLAGNAGPGIARGRAVPSATEIVFVFSGQGSQWAQMGLGLQARFPIFGAALAECDAEVRRFAGWSVLEALSAGEEKLANTEFAQPAIFAIQVALSKLWQSWGISPRMVLGHSIGEVAAAHISSALPLEAAARIVALRGRLMQRPEGIGRMAVIHLGVAEVVKLLGPFGGEVSVACVNGPRSTVVSGKTSAVEALLAQLRERGVATRDVHVGYAFHSPQMQSCSESLLRELGTIGRGEMRAAMISTVTGKRISGSDLDANYWARNIRQPVLFENAIRASAAAGGRIFLEIGPHGQLLESIVESLEGVSSEADDSGQPLAIASMRRKSDESEAIFSALGKLYVAGCPIWWDKVYPEFAAPISLPRYPYQRRRAWIETARPAAASEARPLEMRPVRTPGLTREVFETQVDLETLPYLADHRIGGAVLFPMTAFLETARRALAASGRSAASLDDFAIVQPLALENSAQRALQAVIEGESLQIFSWDGDVWTLHATARIAPVPQTLGAESRLEELPYSGTDGHYRALANSGAELGAAFQTIRAITAGDGWARARVRLGEHEQTDAPAYLIHPALLDGCVQSVIPAIRNREGGLYVPFAIANLAIFENIEGEIEAHATLRSAGQENPDEEAVRADIDLWTAGRLAGRISGLLMKRFHGAPQLHRCIFEVQWQERKRGAALRSTPGQWLIVADAPSHSAAEDDVSQLAADLRQLGCSVAVTSAGKPLERIPGLRAIVRLHAAESNSTPDSAVEACAATLAVAQDAVKQWPTEPPQLWIVTRGAVSLSISSQVPGLAQSAVLGLARTIAMEHPELRCARLDIDATSLGSIAQEMTGWDGEEEIAYCEGRRYVPRLRQAAPVARQWKAGASASIENMRTEPLLRRDPGEGEIEVDVEASALNFRDVLSVLGKYPGPPAPLGLEFCGRVVRIGSGVSEFKPGDRVAGIAPGALSSFVTTPAALAFQVPAWLTSIDAVTLPNAFLTAYHCLRYLAKLERGQRVLIHAATGGVGLAAVAIARLKGTEIFATAGSEEKRAYLRRMGIAQVFDSRSLEFAQQILAATRGEGVDVVLNSLPGDFVAAGFSVLRSGGCFVEIGKNGVWSEKDAQERRSDCRYYKVDLAETIEFEHDRVRSHLAEIYGMLDRREIVPLPSRRFHFEDAPKAFLLMAQAKHIGKIVLCHHHSAAIRPDRTYLITGGFGAIGLSAAQWLARGGARYLALLGRRAPSATAATAIAELERAGVIVAALQADVASRQELGIAFEKIEDGMPPIAGIVHAAGILDDGVIEEQTSARMARVMRPKAAGASNLAELAQSAPLEFFLICSSIASVTGSPGQAGYAAANAWLDAFSHHQNALGVPALSINWGPWSGGGMATETGNKRRSLPALQSMMPEEYWECLEVAMRCGNSQLAIVQADWNRWNPLPSILRDLAPVSGEPSAKSPVKTESLARHLEETPVKNRRALLLDHLRAHAKQILGLDASSIIDDQAPLVRLGLDSLMAVELRNHLSAAIERPLPATLLFDHPSLSSLADYLLGADTPAAAPADALLEEVCAISEAEAEALLKQELESL